MNHRLATSYDASLLGRLNHELIHDEGRRNPMTVTELTERMLDWLGKDYRAVIFERKSEPIAYALFSENDERVHLRQFYVQRAHRRCGVGVQCMQVLFSEVWPPDKRISVDVRSHNEAGIAFWRSLGFTDYSLTLETYPHQVLRQLEPAMEEMLLGE
mgnify:CR=1 FL=1